MAQFYDSGDVTPKNTFNPVRNIAWNSDVFLTAGPAPRLVIDAAGHVLEATNISFIETPTEFLVNTITFNDQGTAHFFTNDVAGGAPAGRMAGDQSTFRFQQNFDVTILNASAKDVEVESIDPNNRLTTPEVTIDVPNDGGFSFDVGQSYTSSLVDIESTGATGASVLVAGIIDNPIGVTKLVSVSGDVLQSNEKGLVITNSFQAQAPQGTLGDAGGFRFPVELVESGGRPTHMTIAVGNDVYLSLQGRQRTLGATTFTVNVDSISAGGEVSIIPQTAVRETTLPANWYAVEVNEPRIPLLSEVINHFRPGPGDLPPTVETGVFAFNPQAIEATYNFGLVQGTNLDIVSSASTPLIHLSGNSNVLSGGRLVAGSNGNVTFHEITGDLPVGAVLSTRGDATLSAQGSIFDFNNTADPNVIAANITLTSFTGAIGSLDNPLDINTSFEASGVLTADAVKDIVINETSGALHVAHARTQNGVIQLTTIDTSATGQDLYLNAGGVISNLTGPISLRGGDDVRLLPGSVVQTGLEGGGSITILGDFGNADRRIGTNIIVEGTLSGPAITLQGDIDNDVISLAAATIVGAMPQVFGLAGADNLVGGVNGAAFFGGPGNDQIQGGPGNDIIDGGDDDDVIFGGDGNDTITGDAGNDQIHGQGGNDDLDGGDGDDQVDGGPGNDTIRGGNGNDRIAGGPGDDTIDGGDGNDNILAGDGNDTVNAGAGDDFMDGGTGIDFGDGGPGTDNCVNFETEINCEDPVILLLSASSAVPAGRSVTALTDDMIAPLANEALRRWMNTVQLSATQVALLENLTYLVADLPGETMSESIRSTVIIDPTAAGWGWFVDSSPIADDEFQPQVGTSQLVAITGAASGSMDLLTAITHEMGNVLGLPEEMADQSSDVMAATLGTGIRRSPTGADAQALASVSEVLPQVTSVVVANSAWSGTFLSSLEAANLGTVGYAIGTTGDDAAPLPWTDLNQVKITFSAFADVEQDTLTVVGDAHGAYAVHDFAYDFATNTATWTLSGSIGNDRVQVILAPHANGTSATDGSSSLIQSPSLAPTGDFHFGFTVLPGDTNQDGIVNSQDLALVAAGWLGHGPIGDVNADGVVNAQDLAIVSSQWLATTPAQAILTSSGAAVAADPAITTPVVTIAASSTVAAETVLASGRDSSIDAVSSARPLIPGPQGISASATRALFSGAALPLEMEKDHATPTPTNVDRWAASMAKSIVADRATVDHLMSNSGDHPSSSWQATVSEFRDKWQSENLSAWSADATIDDEMVDLLAVVSLSRIGKSERSGT